MDWGGNDSGRRAIEVSKKAERQDMKASSCRLRLLSVYDSERTPLLGRYSDIGTGVTLFWGSERARGPTYQEKFVKHRGRIRVSLC
jgi:hypothetical protein